MPVSQSSVQAGVRWVRGRLMNAFGVRNGDFSLHRVSSICKLCGYCMYLHPNCIEGERYVCRRGKRISFSTIPKNQVKMLMCTEEAPSFWGRCGLDLGFCGEIAGVKQTSPNSSKFWWRNVLACQATYCSFICLTRANIFCWVGTCWEPQTKHPAKIEDHPSIEIMRNKIKRK